MRWTRAYRNENETVFLEDFKSCRQIIQTIKWYNLWPWYITMSDYDKEQSLGEPYTQIPAAFWLVFHTHSWKCWLSSKGRRLSAQLLALSHQETNSTWDISMNCRPFSPSFSNDMRKPSQTRLSCLFSGTGRTSGGQGEFIHIKLRLYAAAGK